MDMLISIGTASLLVAAIVLITFAWLWIWEQWGHVILVLLAGIGGAAVMFAAGMALRLWLGGAL